MLMTVFFICYSLFLCAIGEFQDFFSSIIISVFSFVVILCYRQGMPFFWGADRKSKTSVLMDQKSCFVVCHPLFAFFVVAEFYCLFCYYVWTTVWILCFHCTV